MGLAENNKQGYEYASNLLFTERLKGKLLLIHGTADKNTPFSGVIRQVDALVRANKPYDLLVLPGQRHALRRAAHEYAAEALRRYFQEHLKP